MAIRSLQPTEEPGEYLAAVEGHDLPERASRLIDEYEATIGDREGFLWKWAHHLFPMFTLSCVPATRVDRLQDEKLVGLMFVSVLDDVAERHGDRATFEEAVKIPFDHQSPNLEREEVDGDVIGFASDLWEEFSPALADAPRSSEFGELLRFDLKQVLNAIDYSYVANEHVDLVNGSELQTYEAHNMMLFTFADVDIVHSPSFDRSELSTFRRVIERAQRMVRIGNWVTTWERELYESDFTSGIVVYALENGIVSIDDLNALEGSVDAEDVERVAEAIRSHGVEDAFLHQWNEELAAARASTDDVDSVDVAGYLDGVETVMNYHLASRGLK